MYAQRDTTQDLKIFRYLDPEAGHKLDPPKKVDYRRGLEVCLARKTIKSDTNHERVEYHEALSAFEANALDLLGLDEALTRLGEMDPQLARLVELRFFGGLTIAETASVLEVSGATVERGWRSARLWLRAELEEGEDSDAG